jgi:hypothetical protein
MLIGVKKAAPSGSAATQRQTCTLFALALRGLFGHLNVGWSALDLPKLCLRPLQVSSCQQRDVV